jgi:hypothetical protein
MGPPNPHGVRKTLLQDRDGLGGQAYVAVNLAPLACQTPVAQNKVGTESGIFKRGGRA